MPLQRMSEAEWQRRCEAIAADLREAMKPHMPVGVEADIHDRIFSIIAAVTGYQLELIHIVKGKDVSARDALVISIDAMFEGNSAMLADFYGGDGKH